MDIHLFIWVLVHNMQVPFWYHCSMAINLRIPEELDQQLDIVAGVLHTSKSAVLLQGAQLMVEQYARRAEIDSGLDFVLENDAELLHRLEDA